MCYGMYSGQSCDRGDQSGVPDRDIQTAGFQ